MTIRAKARQSYPLFPWSNHCLFSIAPQFEQVIGAVTALARA